MRIGKQPFILLVILVVSYLSSVIASEDYYKILGVPKNANDE